MCQKLFWRCTDLWKKVCGGTLELCDNTIECDETPTQQNKTDQCKWNINNINANQQYAKNNINANATSTMSTLINTNQHYAMPIYAVQVNNAIECDGGEKCVPPMQCDKN